ncbi:MAG: Serine/threonine-protein kinase PRP4 [Paramarteilia canceri]
MAGHSERHNQALEDGEIQDTDYLSSENKEKKDKRLYKSSSEDLKKNGAQNYYYNHNINSKGVVHHKFIDIHHKSSYDVKHQSLSHSRREKDREHSSRHSKRHRSREKDHKSEKSSKRYRSLSKERHPRRSKSKSKSNKKVKFDSNVNKNKQKNGEDKAESMIDFEWNDEIDEEKFQSSESDATQSKHSPQSSENEKYSIISEKENVDSANQHEYEPENSDDSANKNPIKHILNTDPKPVVENQSGNDMFSDNFQVTLKNEMPSVNFSLPSNESLLQDDFDDAEGYYKIKIGELIDGKFLVKSLLGKGVFSNVVCAHVVEGEYKDREVAIKITRNNALM